MTKNLANLNDITDGARAARLRRFRPGDWRLSPYNGKSTFLRPFLPVAIGPVAAAAIAHIAKINRISIEEAIACAEHWRPTLAFQNGSAPNDYLVTAEEQLLAPEWETIWLSIKRNDQAPIHDWRDLQEIKNMIVGPEYEAIELYPADDRVVDAANQFHLFVNPDPSFRYRLGFEVGEKDYSNSMLGALQRPLGFR
jgi:hypothetical protein